MGCWNATCLVTNLPILTKELVRVLFLVKTPSRNGGTVYYPTDLYSLLPFSITGEYNDYGAIEDSTANGHTIPLLLKMLNVSSVEELFTLSHKERLTVTGLDYTFNGNQIIPNYKASKLVIPVMIKESAFHTILQSHTIDPWFGTLPIQRYTDMAPKIVPAVVAGYHKPNRFGPFGVADTLVVSEEDAICRIGSSFSHFGREYSEKSVKNLIIDNPDQIEDIVRDAFDLFWFHSWCAKARMMLTPQSSGSQDTDVIGQRIRAQIIIDEAVKLEKIFEDYE